jgi:hypothetical protein
MQSTIKINRLMLASIALGTAGALWSLGAPGSNAHAAPGASGPQDMCAIAASIAGADNPGLAADLRRAAGCPAG